MTKLTPLAHVELASYQIVNGFVIVGPCEPQWTTLLNRNAWGGTFYLRPTTLLVCQTYCASVPSCVAVDFNSLDNSCWVHNSADALRPDNMYDQINTNQYRINRVDCSPTTTTTTTPLPAPSPC